MTEFITINNQELTEDYINKVQNLCRLCLFQSKELDLYSDSYLPDKKWIDILISVTNDHYIENNKKEYPQGICEECSSKLVLFYKFKQKVASSYNALEQIFKSFDYDCASNGKVSKNYETKDFTYSEFLEDDFIEEVPVSEDEENLGNFTILVDNIYDLDNSEVENKPEIKYEDKISETFQENENKIGDLFDSEKVCYLEVAEEEDKLFHDSRSIMNEDQELFLNETLDEYDNENEDEVNTFRESNKTNITKRKKAKNIQCEICGAKFTRNSSLKQHASVHSMEKKFECNLCYKKFTRRAHVDIHMLIHSNIRPHSCEVCGRAFTKSGDLKRHKKIHSDVYDFVCLICNKEFKRKEYLTAHINSHYDVKPHKCIYCSKCYQSLSGLIKHRKSVHSCKENT